MRLYNPYTEYCNFFGYGVDGNFESNGNVELDSSDQSYCYKFFDDFIINSNDVVTTSHPCKGLYIYVRRNCIINGLLTMTNRGIFSPPDNYPNGYTPEGLDTVILSNGQNTRVKVSTQVTAMNTNGSNGACGGGGKGGGQFASNVGSLSGIFSGGAGGSGSCHTTSQFGGIAHKQNGQPGVNYGGAGGDSFSIRVATRAIISGGAGAGNPGGLMNDVTHVYNGPTGTGGLLYLIANSLVLTSGKISSVGQPGLNGLNVGTSSAYYGGGGGSGGGSVTILYRQPMSTVLISNINVAGGAGGTGNNGAGSSGGSGSIRSIPIW